LTDRLSLANALADAKIDRPAAERIATEIFEAIHDSVATKADLQLLRSELKADIQHIEGRIDALRNEIALLEPRLLIRLGGVMVVLLGLLFAALRYLPPVH
jgi:hypothetical protein